MRQMFLHIANKKWKYIQPLTGAYIFLVLVSIVSIVLDIDCYCWLNLLLSPPATWSLEPMYRHLQEPAKIIVTTEDLNFTEDSEAA